MLSCLHSTIQQRRPLALSCAAVSIAEGVPKVSSAQSEYSIAGWCVVLSAVSFFFPCCRASLWYLWRQSVEQMLLRTSCVAMGMEQHPYMATDPSKSVSRYNSYMLYCQILHYCCEYSSSCISGCGSHISVVPACKDPAQWLQGMCTATPCLAGHLLQSLQCYCSPEPCVIYDHCKSLARLGMVFKHAAGSKLTLSVCCRL